MGPPASDATAHAGFLGAWSSKERLSFKKALFQFGNDWESVSRVVGSRTEFECRRFYELNTETLRPQIEQHMRGLKARMKAAQKQHVEAKQRLDDATEAGNRNDKKRLVREAAAALDSSNALRAPADENVQPGGQKVRQTMTLSLCASALINSNFSLYIVFLLTCIFPPLSVRRAMLSASAIT